MQRDKKILKDAASLIMFAVKKQSVSRPDKDQIKTFLLKWLPNFYKLEKSEEKSDERFYNLMYSGNAHFLFMRLHGLLCERLAQIRDQEWLTLNPLRFQCFGMNKALFEFFNHEIRQVKKPSFLVSIIWVKKRFFPNFNHKRQSRF